MTLRKKLWITVACLSVILCTLVTGTIAWLTDKTDPITNTFTASDITVKLEETGFNGKMVPGTTIDKMAKVTVTNDIKCYVFIKVDASSVLTNYVAYSVDTSVWTALEGKSGVYYKIIDTTGTNSFTILGNGSTTIKEKTYTWEANKVLVRPDVTKSMMQDLNKSDATQPTLTFTAYACQYEGFENNIADAWAAASGSN
jgi:hypothetical protein